MMREELGKIQNVFFGRCGYQDAGFGIQFTLGGQGWGVVDNGIWWWEGKPSKYAKWSSEDQETMMVEACNLITELITKANVKTLNDLIGIPVRVYFDNGNVLNKWEILEEVL